MILDDRIEGRCTFAPPFDKFLYISLGDYLTNCSDEDIQLPPPSGQVYDKDDENFDVDPVNDIKTDKFAIIEEYTHIKDADRRRSRIEEVQRVSQSPTPSEPPQQE